MELNGKYPHGCYYISYEDCYIENGIVGINGVSDVDYEKIYQYDWLGVSSSIELSSDFATSIFGANVFYRNIEERPVEELKSISVESLVNEKVKVYINKNDSTLNIQDMEEVELESNVIQNGGTTLYFKEPILLTGKTFAIAIEYINEDGKPSVGIENRSSKYWQTASAEEGESFCSFNGVTNWIDLNSEGFVGYEAQPNICIKAYTNTVLDINNYLIDDQYIYNIEPETKVSDFIQKINAKIDIILLNNTRQILNSNDILYTGCIMMLEDGTEYIVAVNGDIDSNGLLNENDILKMENYLVQLTTLSDAEKKAADYSLDENISITDYVQMLKQAGMIEEKR